MRRSVASPALWALSLVAGVTSQEKELPSKRGLAYMDTHKSDIDLLLSAKSDISWYYTWSTYPAANINSTIPFVPLVHGLGDASSLGGLNGLPATSTHLLTFNEPDGTSSSGGSSISASDAAKTYIEKIVPLRKSSGRSWKISHPCVTGSDHGLSWLREFNASCWALDPQNGCPADFVALHWYGDFAGMASWLGKMKEFYVTEPRSGAVDPDNLKFWITEMALPKQSEDKTVAMMNQSVSYLDGLDYVQAYAWFGAFRKDSKGNAFTGDNVAYFNKKGALTDVGALYLGGKKKGFKAGMTSGASAGFGGSGCGFMSVFTVVAAGLTIAINLW